MSSELPTIFLSYSHQDESLKDQVAKHLRVLQGWVTVWDDRQLTAGEDWYSRITEAIETAEVAVLLISADFLTSEFILSEEVPRLLDRRKQEGMVIFPVLLSACPWEEIPWLASMQMLPTDACPLTALQGNDREVALTEIAREVVRLAEGQGAQQAEAAETPAPNYSDPASQELAEALETAYQRHEDLITTGGDTSLSQQTILGLKRQMREEGQLKPGDFLAGGRFKLLDILGRGGFSTVFRAFDKQDQSLVAVKVLHPQYSQDRSRRERFFRGARKMGELQHQGIVRVIEPKANDGGYYFFVMEYVEGGDLRQAVTSGQVSGVRGLEILSEVAEALDLAHRRGVVHRDVKPANILLTPDGKAKLTDFDLVRAVDTTAGTRTGSALGTFPYMAPEAMISAEQAGPAADIYSLAMSAAFVQHGEEIPATFLRSSEAFFDGLDASEKVKEVLQRATAWEPTERFSSVIAFSEALATGSDPLADRPPDDGTRLDRPPNQSIIVRAELSEPTASQEVEQAKNPKLSGGWSLFIAIVAVFLVVGKWVTSKLGDVAPLEPLLIVSRAATDHSPETITVPAGQYEIGSPESEDGHFKDELRRNVKLTRAFEIGSAEVTQEQYRRVMGKNPSSDTACGRKCPVTNVSWLETVMYLNALSKLNPTFKICYEIDGEKVEWVTSCNGYRLPTEAEWEVAARAGKDQRYAGTDDPSEVCKFGNVGDTSYKRAANPSWKTFRCNDGQAQLSPVKEFRPSDFQLYDMTGSVWEWVWDWYSASPEFGDDPAGPSSGRSRVIRGGSFGSSLLDSRVAFRGKFEPSGRLSSLGFRVARSIPTRELHSVNK